jgi:hypothetical protein
MLKYFGWSYVFTAIAVLAGYLLGGWKAAGIIIVLGVLETSLSFDNAVINASVLKNWDKKWRDRFVTWGLPIAVFGMRVVFPLLIVGIVGSIGPIDTVKLAWNQPDEYARILTSAHLQIAAFGGTFLLMVFLKFFLDANKEEHWLTLLEHPLAKMARFTEVLVLGVLAAFSMSLTDAQQGPFLLAGVFGLASYLLVAVLGDAFGGEDEGNGAAAHVIKQGWGGFLYLELVDASFSFDGVIAAFALSTNIIIIALGLGIGAMFVRSMTIMLVEKNTMSQFRYLEHGAFWAIGVLALIMFVSVKHHVPEVVTGLIGAGAIVAAIWSSMRANRRDELAAVASS